MTYHDDAAWVIDMLHIVRNIERDLKDLTYDKYLRDSQAQEALLYSLTVLVRASGEVSEQFQEKHSSIPWHELRGLRETVKEYWNIDHSAVWTFLTTVHPTLLPKLETLDADRRSQESNCDG